MIIAENLNKSYVVPVKKNGKFSTLKTFFSNETKVIHAVKDMNFKINPGEFVGYIGPNGAGKSTTIKMLTGILHQDNGKLLINGMNPQKSRRKVALNFGAVFGQRTQLWWDLPVKDSFELLSAMYKVEKANYNKVLKVYTELLEIDSLLDVPVRKLSLGQRVKADICASLLHNPDLLFLDEPTIGLDVTAKNRIRSFLKQLNKEEGKTILLTTHDMTDIKKLCDRIIVIDHGTKIYDGTIKNLENLYNLPTEIIIEFANSISTKKFPAYVSFDYKSSKAKVMFYKDKDNLLNIVKTLGAYGEIKDIEVIKPNLDELVQHIYTSSTPKKSEYI